MKLQVTQENLAKALNIVAKVANTRNTLPILANILIKTSNNRLSLSATNLDIAITCYIGSKISSEGSITIPARLTQDFISNLPSDVVNLELKDNKLHIDSGKYNSTINGINAEEFPVMPSIQKGRSLKLNSHELKKALSQVVFSASNDDSRPVLTGVYIHSQKGHLVIAATDSYRLAERKIGPANSDVSILVPAGAAADLLRIVSDADDQTISMVYDDQQVAFELPDVTLVARLIDGVYPEYQKLIPNKFTTTATLKRQDFINITKVSSLFARESAGSVTLKVDKPGISINSIASQLGENTATADAQVSGGGEVTLNSRYLLEGLNAFGGEEIDFCFNGKLEPCVLKSKSEPDYLHIVMPLRS